VLRISELSLPLDYAPEALTQAVLQRLAIPAAELLEVNLFKRSYDARKKNSSIVFVCIVDVAVRDEQAVLQRLAHDRQVSLAPDTSYHPVARAPVPLPERPLVVGFGPCGLFAALLLAQSSVLSEAYARLPKVAVSWKLLWIRKRHLCLPPARNLSA
jgi:uncharacterized FAD-dependent dehydrogenase